MADRKYSVAEIDRMRHAISCGYMGPSNSTLIEDRLRTYMLNGTDPEELEQDVRRLQPIDWDHRPGVINHVG